VGGVREEYRAEAPQEVKPKEVVKEDVFSKEKTDNSCEVREYRTPVPGPYHPIPVHLPGPIRLIMQLLNRPA